MNSVSFRGAESFDCPAVYQIRVLGFIDPGWSNRLEGMEISHFTKSSGDPVSILKGELRDQAALAGVLSTLYNYHFTVLKVKRYKIPQDKKEEPQIE